VSVQKIIYIESGLYRIGFCYGGFIHFEGKVFSKSGNTFTMASSKDGTA